MELGFQAIADWLRNGAKEGLNEQDFSEACHRRLIRAFQKPETLGVGDVAALIRHVLRREMEIQEGGSPSIRIPRQKPFPKKRETWERSGISILREEQDFFVISAEPWKPEWLPQAEQESPEAPLFREKERRNQDPVPGDPFLAEFGLETYKSVGQREAIRSILTAPPKSTLVVNLPTGSGKSLCAHLPACLKAKPVGVTIVVVPTVALAIDQERAFQQMTNTPIQTAYYSDSSIEGQEKREEIRDRIRQGTQPIVFTSPEGLIESLSFSVYEAARRGYLRYLVIDEAHIVEQWGDEFRPEFQELAGLRRSLLRICEEKGYQGFPTLLLTATVTESCLDTLETLFGEPGPFAIVASVQLRPEPSYWFAYCATQSERQERLSEAVANLPRPLIVYGSKVQDVDHWYRYLREMGFQRCSKMTGQSSQRERLALLHDWQVGLIDIVVATSAFGLGVDLPDVRAVIHVCIPETIDRFYQEVGRGGRDGKASLSLILYAASDFKDAANIGEITYITTERGRKRWQEMFAKKRTLPDGRFQVPINVSPSYNLDLDASSIRNQDWNVRTLTLMSRARLIDIDAEPPPQTEDGEDFQQAVEEYKSYRTIHIRDEQHLQLETWEVKFEPARTQRQDWARHSFSLMNEALRPKRCFSDIFSEAYSIPKRDLPHRRRVHVEQSCGGCSACRNEGVEPFVGGTPLPVPVWDKPHFYLGESLKKLLDGETLLLIFYSEFEEKRMIRKRDRFFNWLIHQGIQNVVAPTALQGNFAKQSGKFPVFLFDEYRPLQMLKVPTLIFHSEHESLSSRHLLPPAIGVPRILLLPNNTPDPTASHRRLKDIFSGRSFYFEFLYGELGL